MRRYGKGRSAMQGRAGRSFSRASCLCRVQKSIEQKLNDWGASRGRLIVHSNNNRNCVTRRAPGGRRRTKERGKGRNKDNGIVERAGDVTTVQKMPARL